jgi:hypothetical protein
VKIIEDDETAAQYVLAQPRYFIVVEIPVPDLLCKQPRVIEEFFIGQPDMPAVVGDLETREPPQASREMILGIRVVDRPPGAPCACRIATRVNHSASGDWGSSPPIDDIATANEKNAVNAENDFKMPLLHAGGSFDGKRLQAPAGILDDVVFLGETE